jgi:hypothetical protein
LSLILRHIFLQTILEEMLGGTLQADCNLINVLMDFSYFA